MRIDIQDSNRAARDLHPLASPDVCDVVLMCSNVPDEPLTRAELTRFTGIVQKRLVKALEPEKVSNVLRVEHRHVHTGEIIPWPNPNWGERLPQHLRLRFRHRPDPEAPSEWLALCQNIPCADTPWDIFKAVSSRSPHSRSRFTETYEFPDQPALPLLYVLWRAGRPMPPYEFIRAMWPTVPAERVKALMVSAVRSLETAGVATCVRRGSVGQRMTFRLLAPDEVSDYRMNLIESICKWYEKRAVLDPT